MSSLVRSSGDNWSCFFDYKDFMTTLAFGLSFFVLVLEFVL